MLRKYIKRKSNVTHFEIICFSECLGGTEIHNLKNRCEDLIKRNTFYEKFVTNRIQWNRELNYVLLDPTSKSNNIEL